MYYLVNIGSGLIALRLCLQANNDSLFDLQLGQIFKTNTQVYTSSHQLLANIKLAESWLLTVTNVCCLRGSLACCLCLLLDFYSELYLKPLDCYKNKNKKILVKINYLHLF